MDTIKKGKLGYNLLEKQLLLRNFDIYTPVLEDTKIDAIIIKGNKLSKIQIKILSNDKRNCRKYLPVRKISHNQGEYKVHLYTAEEIDFFIGVDLDSEDIYICPVDFIQKYQSSIGLTALQPYKNNFSLLEPNNGNIISGEDDIGETLTGNTEGID